MQNTHFRQTIWNRIFRYGVATVIILLGFILSFFMFSYCDTANKIERNEENDRQRYVYEDMVSYLAYGEDFNFDNIEYEKFSMCDIFIQDTMLYVGKSEYPRTADIVILGEQLIYPIVSGRYPDSRDLVSAMPCVVLGRDLQRYTYKDGDSDYVLINNDVYLVTGYVGADNSAIFDYKVILYYENLENGVSRDLEYYKNNAGVVITFNFKNNNDEAGDCLVGYEKLYPDGFINIDYENFRFSNAYSTSSKRLAFLVCCFSVAIIILAVVFWYLSNLKEFAIRRACGYSSARIILMILKRIMCLLITALVISELIMFGMNWLEQDYNYGRLVYYLNQIVMINKYIVIVVPIVLVYPIFKICTDKPDMLIRKTE